MTQSVPGGWNGADLADTSSWRLPIPGEVNHDLLRIASTMPREDIAADPFPPRPRVSADTRAFVGEVHRRLCGEPGFVVLTGFPVAEAPELAEAAYWAFGLAVGAPVREGTGDDEPLITRVENVGRDGDQEGGQGFHVSDALPFHIDRCTDLVGLLCVRAASSGGMSRLVSSKRLNNLLYAHDRDLHAELCRPIPFRMPPLRAAYDVPQWCEIPVFSQIGADFVAHYIRPFFEQTQHLPGAPRLTDRQVVALDVVDELLTDPELPLDMYLRPGDIQLINNLHVLHTRTGYRNAAGVPGRLLLRLHLAFPGSPTLPDSYLPMFGTTRGGTYRGGVWRTHDYQCRIGKPLPEYEMA